MPDNQITAPEFWVDFLYTHHPQITKVSFSHYPLLPHGKSDTFGREVRPVLPSSSPELDLFRKINFSFGNELVAINSIVDVCDKKECSHSVDDHLDEYYYFLEHYYDGLWPQFSNPQSFLFLDLESPEKTLPEKVFSAFNNLEDDVYLFFSGGSFHAVIDRLVLLEKLPLNYGLLLNKIAEEDNNLSLLGYGSDLVDNGSDTEKVKRWCEDVLDTCGHVDDANQKEVYLVDLRYIAHSLLRLTESLKYIHVQRKTERPDLYERHDYGAAYLRISNRPGKYDSPPILIGQKIDGTVKMFDYEKPKKQMPLF